MPGYLCSFLDSGYSFPYHIPSKPFRILNPIHVIYNPLPNSRIIRRSRRRIRIRRDPLQLSVLPQHFDLVQTSEHYDGSLVFRFGDPSEIAKSDAVVEDLDSQGEVPSDTEKVLDRGDEGGVIVETIVSEERSDISEVDSDITFVEREIVVVGKDLTGSQVESSQRDDLVEDLASEGEDESNVSKVLDEDQVIAKSVERQAMRDSNIRSSIDVSDRISEVDIAVEMESYVEKDISASQVESSERSLEISQEGEVCLPVPISVSDFHTNDIPSSDLGFTKVDEGKCSDEKDEDAISSSTTTTGTDSFSVKSIDDSEEVVTIFNSPTFKLDLTIEDPDVEGGLQTELAVNEAEEDITVFETESDVVGDLSDSEPEWSQRTLENSREVKVSDSWLQVEAVNEVEKDITVIESKNKSDVVEVLGDSERELSDRTLNISKKVQVSYSGLQVEAVNEAEKDIAVIESESEMVGDFGDSELELSERTLEISRGVEASDTGLQIEAVNEAENDITVIETESDVVGDLRDSELELSERTLKTSHKVKVSGSGLQIEAADNINIAETDITLKTASNILENLNDSQLESGERPLVVSQEVEVPSGLQTVIANSINKEEKEITVTEMESDVVGNICDSQPELSERLLEISQEVEVPVSDITTNDYLQTVSRLELEDAVDDKDDSNEEDEDDSPMSRNVTDNSVLVENSGDTEEVTTKDSGDVTVVQSPSVELDNLVLQDPSTEVMNFSVDAKDQNIVADSQLGSANDSGEEVTTLSQGLQAEPVVDGGVGHDALVESAEADCIESPVMLNQDVANSLVEAERTEWEKQSSELSQISIVEATQLDLTGAGVKREKNSTAAFFLSSGAAVLAHPSKALTGGEDAYFLTRSNWLGIADGVSQWSLDGTEPGVYAHELMKNCEIIVSDNSSASMVNPLKVLSKSVKETQSSGSSTVLVAYFDGLALHVANIGDTGFMIIRHDGVYKKSSPMLHELNFPLLIERGDDPLELAEEYRIDLDEGDTVIVATNGLFDNLYEQEIVSVVSKSLRATMKPQEIAKVLATRAQEVGGSACARSPFADAVQAAGYTGYTGGKLDDVAVIVSFVEKGSNSHIQ